MKQLVWALVSLGVLVIGLSWLVVGPHHGPSPQCAGRIVIVPGPRGMPLECICYEGRLGTCFNPGS
jgi:hypothetical protein